jgi:hypothetical protein
MGFKRRPEQLARGNDLGRQRLADGSLLAAWSSPEGMFVQRESGGAVAAQLRFRYPRAGLGGGRLVVSPHGRRAVLSYFSGQSEEAFELIDLDEGLRSLAHQDYVFGQTAEFGFSPDEDIVVAFIPQHGDMWWPEDEDDVDLVEDGRRRFHLGCLVVHAVSMARTTAHELTAVTERMRPPNNTAWEPSPIPELTPPRLRLPMPWSTVELKLPLPPEIIVIVP